MPLFATVTVWPPPTLRSSLLPYSVLSDYGKAVRIKGAVNFVLQITSLLESIWNYRKYGPCWGRLLVGALCRMATLHWRSLFHPCQVNTFRFLIRKKIPPSAPTPPAAIKTISTNACCSVKAQLTTTSPPGLYTSSSGPSVSIPQKCVTRPDGHC